MQAEYAASFGAAFPPKATTHAIAGEFDYSRIAEAKTLCGRSGPFSVNHTFTYGEKPAVVDVTCKTCVRVDSKPAKRARSRSNRAGR